MSSRHISDEDVMCAMDGELTHVRRATVEAHLADCHQCRERLTHFEEVSAALGSAPEPVVAGHAESMERLRLALQREANGCRHLPARSLWWRPRLAAVAAAGVACGLVASAVLPLGAGPTLERRARPVTSLTPGATWQVTRDDLCTGRVPQVQDIADRVRREVVASYGMAQVHTEEYELDYLITPELGGAPDRRNLWPQRYDAPVWNARVKDQLERLLPQLVCTGQVDLATAQRDIAEDWIAAYRKYFRSDTPLPTPEGNASDDDGPAFANMSEPYRLASGRRVRIQVILPRAMVSFVSAQPVPPRAPRAYRPQLSI